MARSGPILAEGERKQGLHSPGRVSPGLSWHFLSCPGGAVPKIGGRVCAWMCSGLVTLWAFHHQSRSSGNHGGGSVRSCSVISAGLGGFLFSSQAAPDLEY